MNFGKYWELKSIDWLSDCWTTGCQPKTWAIVGCAQYKKTEMDKFPCTDANGSDGYMYHCCTITNSDQINVGPNSTTGKFISHTLSQYFLIQDYITGRRKIWLLMPHITNFVNFFMFNLL